MGHSQLIAFALLAASAIAMNECVVTCINAPGCNGCVPCAYSNGSQHQICRYMNSSACLKIGSICQVFTNTNHTLLPNTTSPRNETIIATIVPSITPQTRSTNDSNSSMNSTTFIIILIAVTICMLVIIGILVYRWQKLRKARQNVFSLVGIVQRPYQPAIHDTIRSPTPEIWARKYSLFASQLSKLPQDSTASYLDTTNSSDVDPWVFKERSSSYSSEIAHSQSIVMMRETATFAREDEDQFDMTGVYGRETPSNCGYMAS
ncbi:hypothetical protein THRCLA_21668 [Thraustotheca clavata]|uniref:Secreted protein n=1 Tax=Thraustotheca clavata TaxID=74557 RepID=A0A1V9ZRM5_9STRA|nr:hypothetical protein THRCLA_21668 [Thraustotheca clavata]